MRRFLYYDEDSINSFLAQIEKGLLTKKGKEKEITDTVSIHLNPVLSSYLEIRYTARGKVHTLSLQDALLNIRSYY